MESSTWKSQVKILRDLEHPVYVVRNLSPPSFTFSGIGALFSCIIVYRDSLSLPCSVQALQTSIVVVQLLSHWCAKKGSLKLPPRELLLFVSTHSWNCSVRDDVKMLDHYNNNNNNNNNKILQHHRTIHDSTGWTYSF